LQVSLLIIGIVVVGGVTAFNWFQQWRLRRRLEQAFDGKHEDVLLREPTSREPARRVEPQLGAPRTDDAPRAGAAYVADQLRINAQQSAAAGTALPPVPTFDPVIDYIVAIDAPEPISAAGLAELHTKAALCGKRFRVVG